MPATINDIIDALGDTQAAIETFDAKAAQAEALINGGIDPAVLATIVNSLTTQTTALVATQASLVAALNSGIPAETSALTVASTNPADSVTGVSVAVHPTVTFSAGAQEIEIAIKNGSTVLPSTTVYDPDTFTATVTPTSILPAATLLNVEVDAQDLAGVDASELTDFAFTTA